MTYKKASPNGVNDGSRRLFSFWIEQRYYVSVGNADSYFQEECLADKWYKVSSVENDSDFLINCFLKIVMTHTKEENNTCSSKAWWQDKLVLDKNVNCQTNNYDMKLYISGANENVDGQVRNFSYVKK